MSNPYEVSRLTRAFRVSPTRIDKIQNGVYRLTLENGKTYALKKMPIKLGTLRWIDRSLNEMRRTGYTKLGWRNAQTSAGNPLFVQLRRNSSPNILVPWISGRWPSVYSTKDMKDCGIALARFHKVAKQCRLNGSGVVNNARNWLDTLRSKHVLMLSKVNKVRNSGKIQKRKMDRFLLEHGTEIIAYSNKARQLLRKSDYSRLYHTHRHLITLCHGDGGPSNFILNRNGVHLIDFETLGMDFRAYDLYRVIYNSCKDHNWKFSIAKAFLDGYQSVNPLERADFSLLQGLLRFPRSSYLLLRRYPSEDSQLLTHALATERKMDSFFNQLNRYARS